MQIIFIPSPVGKIWKLTLNGQWLLLGVVGSLAALGLYFLVLIFDVSFNYSDGTQGLDGELSSRPPNMSQTIEKIQKQLEVSHHKLIELENMNQKLLGLGIPQRILEANPVLKNLLDKSSKSKGGPLIPAPIENHSSDMSDLLTQSTQMQKMIQTANTQWSAILAVLSSQPIAYPIKEQFLVTSKFGARMDPFTQSPSIHTGLDFQAPTGTNIYASAKGFVRFAGYSSEYGNYVEIDHQNGFVTRYGHASQLLVKKGARVEQNQLIAKVGSSGRSTGPHLHYEILNAQKFINPSDMLASIESF